MDDSVDLVNRPLQSASRGDSHRALFIALAISAAAHAFTYVASYDVGLTWHSEKNEPAFLSDSTTLNAVLTPAAQSLQQSMQAAPDSLPRKIVGAVAKARSRTPRPKPAPAATLPAATFEAPENAIAAIAPDAATDVAINATALNKDIEDSNNAALVTASATTIPAASPNTETTPAPVVAKQEVTSTPPTKAADPAIIFPSRITMAYRMSSSVADGIADFSFTRTGANGRHYELTSTIQATGIFAGLFVGTFRQSSRGEMTPNGIRPQFFSMRRGDAPADTAEFNAAKAELKIIKHGETHLFSMPQTMRMQDTQSFLFQLAEDAHKLKTAGDRLTVSLTNARKLYEYQFRLIGEESLQTRMGTLTTLHVKSDSTDPEDVYEVWLSPKHYYLPVKIKFYMGKFLMEQTVSSISASSQ